MSDAPGASPVGQAGTNRPAWYVSTPGKVRDWLSVLHLPYTAWHLSYVLIGAGLAPVLSVQRLVATLIAFFLAVGVSAHGFDELQGRPLGTSIPGAALAAVSAAALVSAVAVGIVGISEVGFGLLGFILVGSFLVLSYNLEIWDGRLHNDSTFALAWGAFPVLTAYYAQEGSVRPAALFAAVFAFGLSTAQRALSTEARDLRRRTVSVAGEKTRIDGSTDAISREGLLVPIERALIALSWSTCALGTALVVARA
ncbi:MAG TPA: hypothetical protein VFV02_02850 [Acidimicrobiales bacterium]|nr:hypothetical protein [Acidimicrobiales bacterium]